MYRVLIAKQSATAFSVACLVVVLTAGCLRGPSLLTQSGAIKGGEVTLMVATEEDGAAWGTYDPALGSQLLTASSSSGIAGASLLLPVGALSIPTTFTIEPGASIATASVATTIGLSGFGSSGPSVVVSASSNINTDVPMTLSLPLPNLSALQILMSLVEDSYASMIVVYRVKDADTGKFETGTIPRSKVEIKDGKVQVATRRLGSYQAVLVAPDEAQEEKKVEHTDPVKIVTMREEKKLPQIPSTFTVVPASTGKVPLKGTISVTGSNFNDTLSIAIESGGSLYPVQTAMTVSSDGTTVSFAMPLGVPHLAPMDIVLEQSGVKRSFPGPQHDKVPPTATSLVIAPGSVVGGTKFTTSSSVNLTLSATDVQDMYVTNAAGCASGGVWESFASAKSSWTLTGLNQTARVYVKFRDDVGNESPCESDEIVHDNLVPTVLSVSSSKNNGHYKAGEVIEIQIKFSESIASVSGAPSMTLNSGGSANTLVGFGSDTATLSYTVGSSDTSLDLNYSVMNSLYGQFTDLAGNSSNNPVLPDPAGNKSLAHAKDIVIDTTPPNVTNVTSNPAAGALKVGGTVEIIVTFNEPVKVPPGGSPTIALNSLAGATGVYSSGSLSDTLRFNYTVATGHTSSDLDYTSVSALVDSASPITDFAGNNANLVLPNPGTAGSLGYNSAVTIDTTPPADPSVSMIESVNVAPGATVYTNDQTPQISGTCDSDTTFVIVDIAGSPALSAPCSSASWTVSPATDLVHGSYSVRVKARDAAENYSGYSNSYNFDVTPKIFKTARPSQKSMIIQTGTAETVVSYLKKFGPNVAIELVKQSAPTSPIVGAEVTLESEWSIAQNPNDPDFYVTFTRPNPADGHWVFLKGNSNVSVAWGNEVSIGATATNSNRRFVKPSIANDLTDSVVCSATVEQDTRVPKQAADVLKYSCSETATILFHAPLALAVSPSAGDGFTDVRIVAATQPQTFFIHASTQSGKLYSWVYTWPGIIAPVGRQDSTAQIPGSFVGDCAPSIVAAIGGTIYAGGVFVGGTDSGKPCILSSKDGGSTWLMPHSGASLGYGSIKAMTPFKDSLIIGGDFPDKVAQFFPTSSPSFVSQPLSSSYGVTSLAVGSDLKVWALASNGIIYGRLNSGSTWTTEGSVTGISKIAFGNGSLFGLEPSLGIKKLNCALGNCTATNYFLDPTIVSFAIVGQHLYVFKAITSPLEVKVVRYRMDSVSAITPAEIYSVAGVFSGPGFLEATPSGFYFGGAASVKYIGQPTEPTGLAASVTPTYTGKNGFGFNKSLNGKKHLFLYNTSLANVNKRTSFRGFDEDTFVWTASVDLQDSDNENIIGLPSVFEDALGNINGHWIQSQTSAPFAKDVLSKQWTYGADPSSSIMSGVFSGTATTNLSGLPAIASEQFLKMMGVVDDLGPIFVHP
jgi:hypothetical protein